jgi:uncharacterized coiled-coil protein SlyX
VKDKIRALVDGFVKLSGLMDRVNDQVNECGRLMEQQQNVIDALEARVKALEAKS